MVVYEDPEAAKAAIEWFNGNFIVCYLQHDCYNKYCRQRILGAHC